MRAKRKNAVPASPPVVAEVSEDDRIVLTRAYKAGLILTWRLDATRGYCVSRVGQADQYVDAGELTSYVAKLRSAVR